MTQLLLALAFAIYAAARHATATARYAALMATLRCLLYASFSLMLAVAAAALMMPPFAAFYMLALLLMLPLRYCYAAMPPLLR